MNMLNQVRHEIEDLHTFFTDWFNGVADQAQFSARVTSRLHPDFVIVPPDGSVLGVAELTNGFEQSFGTNSDFRIQIRDVVVRFQSGDQVLVTYTEWQSGAMRSTPSNNARFSTALLQIGTTIQWLHLHETWLPEGIRSADPFDF